MQTSEHQINRVPSEELTSRMNRFRAMMNEQQSDWKIVVIFSKINLYYFTGTMQDGMLVIPKDDEAVFWVRKSYERALYESLFPDIRFMRSYSEASLPIPIPDTLYLETEKIPIAMYERFQRYFPFKKTKSVDNTIGMLRAMKSPYEISLMEKSGKIHAHVLEDLVPAMLREGMSEADLATELFSTLIREGHHGVSRFSMFETEMLLGHVGFGESSIYPSYFNGASGNYGMSPSVPLLGSRERKLKKGDLVYIDVGCGFDGYHTDKTTTYMFGAALSDDVISIHKRCVILQNTIASMLKQGSIPSEIYKTIIDSLDSEFRENFMGFKNRCVNFLGHGIGLTVDELPVIAKGFDQPLEERMTFAVEPKKGIAGIGMVGIENTFVVSKDGGRNITGNNTGLIPVNY